MEEQIKEEGQTVVVVDVTGRENVSGTDIEPAEVVDERIGILEKSRFIDGDQTLPGFDVLELAVYRQGEISGNGTHDQQVFFIQTV